MSIKTKPTIPFFALLRWVQAHPKLMRMLDVLLGLLSLAAGVWQQSSFWIAVGVVFLLAAIFRLGERMNLFLPKLKSVRPDKDA